MALWSYFVSSLSNNFCFRFLFTLLILELSLFHLLLFFWHFASFEFIISFFLKLFFFFLFLDLLMLMPTHMLSPRLMSEEISFFCSHAHRLALILLGDEYTLQILYPFRFPLLPRHGAELNSLLFHYPYFLRHFHSVLLLLVMPDNLLILFPPLLLLLVLPNNLLILCPLLLLLLPRHGAELNSLLFHYPYFLRHFL